MSEEKQPKVKKYFLEEKEKFNIHSRARVIKDHELVASALRNDIVNYMVNEVYPRCAVDSSNFFTLSDDLTYFTIADESEEKMSEQPQNVVAPPVAPVAVPEVIEAQVVEPAVSTETEKAVQEANEQK